MSNLDNLDLLTPNYLMLGRNNDRSSSGPLRVTIRFDKIIEVNNKVDKIIEVNNEVDKIIEVNNEVDKIIEVNTMKLIRLLRLTQ